MICPHCGSKIVSYKGENLCLRCPAESKRVIVEDQPTEIGYYENTNIVRYKFWKNKEGKFHKNNDKPACIRYDTNGNIRILMYYINDKYHRDNDKPALISYYENGQINEEVYTINGLRHRDNNKPAYIYYNKSGNIETEEYWVNGIKVK